MNGYALTGEAKYPDWLLQYAGAWRDRVIANRGNIPTNIGLDGTIGGEWGGKRYGGTFGWNFDPSTSGRNYYLPGFAPGERRSRNPRYETGRRSKRASKSTTSRAELSFTQPCL